MCGYITKDEGRPWYQYRVHNIPREDLQQGRLQHISEQTTIDDGKAILTQRNFFSEMFKFSMRSLFPCIFPVSVVAMYALQSAGYIPASDWVRKFSKVDLEEAQALWNPKVITITDTDRLFFDGCSRPCNIDRYFVAPDNSSHCGDSISTPQCDEDNVALKEPCVTPTRQRATPYQNIQNVLQQRTDTPRKERRLGCQPQFLQMPENAARSTTLRSLKTDVPVVFQARSPLLCAQIRWMKCFKLCTM